MTRGIAGQRTPGDGNVHILVRDGLNQVFLGVDFSEISEDAVADEIADDTAAEQRMDRRQAVIALAQNMNADSDASQTRIVE